MPERRSRNVAVVLALTALLGACGNDTSTTATTAAPTTVADTTSSTSDAVSTTDAPSPGAGSDNVWEAATIDPTQLPIGDGSTSTVTAGVGSLYSCAAASPNAPGARADGPWLDNANGTWDSTTKVAVEGAVTWPTAEYSETVEGDTRIITSNGLPVDLVTGTFPIAATDPVFAYDRNPGTIAEREREYSLPVAALAADAPSCLPLEAIGILRNGVVLYNALDARGDDAAAHEALDVCNGHPSQIAYHYHSIPSCIVDATDGPSTVVGWALDGYPIVVERDAAGDLPSNADLDECHGRTSPILLDGETVTTYHYSATLEFPYTLGCFRGTP